MNTIDAIMTRRSTRRFQTREVDEETINRLVEAGRHAPSGGNSQSCHFFVITDRKLLDELAVTARECFAEMEVYEGMYRSLASSIRQSKNGNYVFHYNCPVFIVVANKKDYGNNLADTACALENMMILANEYDLGTCWINQLRWLNEDERIISIFRRYGLQEDERIYGSLAIGYPDSEDGMPSRVPLPRTGNKVERIK